MAHSHAVEDHRQRLARTSILLVEPATAARAILYTAASTFAYVESHAQFETARVRVLLALFDFLVTNVRLGDYNGLHLVYLRSSARGAPCAIVYSDECDSGLAREAQQAGAFYEVATCLPVTLRAYVTGMLPVGDRRGLAILDRRGLFRGGRRSWDRYLVRQVH